MVKLIIILLLFSLNYLSFSMPDEEMEVNRKILKEIALCECLSQSWQNIGLDTLDFSRASIFDNFSYENEVIFTLQKIIKDAIQSSNGRKFLMEGNLFDISNFHCIKLYESFYLDSIVRTFDDKFIPDIFDVKSKDVFKSDSIRYELNFKNSQKEQKNE